MAAASTKGKLSQEQIVNRFNELRQQQKQIGMKIGEISSEIKEHTLVMETLKGVESSRKCWRMIGGVLVERKVEEVMPTLDHNVKQLNVVMKNLEKQLEDKGQELVDYRDEHNIKIHSEAPGKPSSSEQSTETKTEKQAGVLVNS